LAAALRGLLNQPKIAIDRSAVEAGVSMFDAGGDFADGIIAYEGRRLGGGTFVSFDGKAVRLLAAQGHPARSPNGR
jgi:predicted nucleic-acid-binding protein